MPTNPDARAGIWPFSDGEVRTAAEDFNEELACRGVTLRDAVTASRHMLEALKDLGAERCRRRNCGTVCLCGPCHARAELERLNATARGEKPAQKSETFEVIP